MPIINWNFLYLPVFVSGVFFLSVFSSSQIFMLICPAHLYCYSNNSGGFASRHCVVNLNNKLWCVPWRPAEAMIVPYTYLTIPRQPKARELCLHHLKFGKSCSFDCKKLGSFEFELFCEWRHN